MGWGIKISDIDTIHPFGGISNILEGEHIALNDGKVTFSTRTSGNFDGVNLTFRGKNPSVISTKGSLGGYVKVGDPLKGNPHKAQPGKRLCSRVGW